MRVLPLIAAAVATVMLAASARRAPAADERRPFAEKLLFEELFEDTNWAARGWYDGPTMKITADEHVPGSKHSCVWHWKQKGDITPDGKGARVHLPPVSNLTLDFYMKHSANWTWTGVNWHPHEFNFVTSVD